MTNVSTARPMTESTLNIGDGKELKLIEWPGEGDTIVLLHGLAGNAFWWKSLADLMPTKHIIAIDMPGHGLSYVEENWNLEYTATLVHDAVRKNNEKPAIWGGQSWGGKVSGLIAGLYPEDVRALVLIESAPVQGLEVAPEMFVEFRYKGEIGEWKNLDSAIESARTMPQYAQWSDDLKAAFLRGIEEHADGSIVSRLTHERALKIAENAIGKNHLEIVKHVSCPTLLLVARESLGWQEQTNFVAFPSSERVVLDGGHWLHVEAPKACADAIDSWLRKTLS